MRLHLRVQKDGQRSLRQSKGAVDPAANTAVVAAIHECPYVRSANKPLYGEEPRRQNSCCPKQRRSDVGGLKRKPWHGVQPGGKRNDRAKRAEKAADEYRDYSPAPEELDAAPDQFRACREHAHVQYPLLEPQSELV